MRARRANQIYLTGKERLTVQTMVSMEIRSNIECKKMGIEPAFNTEMLRNLYQKLAGREWEEVKDSENQ